MHWARMDVVKVILLLMGLGLVALPTWSGCMPRAESPPIAESVAAAPERRISESARQVLDLLIQLPERKTHRVLLGQHLGAIHELPQEGPQALERFWNETQRHPALIGTDYQHWTSPPGPLQPGNDWLIAAARQGSLITISWHADNPWTQGDSKDLTGVDFAQLMTPGTTASYRWHAELDRIAHGLAALRDARIAVLWRPLHEMNGDWFWWSRLEQSEFVKLWRHMFEYFQQTHRLDHLLWVYSPHVERGATQSVIHFYPGDAYVDVTALDAYDGPELLAGYHDLITLGKPFGLGEFGPPLQQRDGTFDNRLLLKSLRSSFPRTTFVLYWNSWSDQRVAFEDQRHAHDVAHDEWIITRDDLPDLTVPFCR